MEKQIDYFSRKLESKYFENALKIYHNIQNDWEYKGHLLVHTWELYDKAFSFPRVRRYQFSRDNLDMLQHFEDNLNLNINNKQHLSNFLRTARTVRKNLNDEYASSGAF